MRSRSSRLAVAGLLAGLFALLAVAVLLRSPLGPDAALHAAALRARRPLLVDLAVVVTSTGTGPVAYAVAALSGTAGRAVGLRVRGAVLAVLALAAGQLLRWAVSAVLARDRPPVADWAAGARGASFPSGHTTSAALTAGLVCLAVCRTTRDPLRRRLLCGLALLWAASVGLTRVYLGVHWPSDVLGGWLFAGALLLAAVALVGDRLSPAARAPAA